MLHAAHRRAVASARNQIGGATAKSKSNFNSNFSPAERLNTEVIEKIASLFERDTLAAAEYFNNLRTRTLVEPEKKLMLAILEDAVTCFQENVRAQSGKEKRLFDEAEQWFLEGRGEWIFSFRNVCELLGLNPEYLRGGLMRWKQKSLAGTA